MKSIFTIFGLILQSLVDFLKSIIPYLEYLLPSISGFAILYLALWKTSQGLDLVADMGQSYFNYHVIMYWIALTGYALILWFIPKELIKRPNSWQIWSWASYHPDTRSIRSNNFGPAGDVNHLAFLRIPRLITALTMLAGGMIFIKFYMLEKSVNPDEIYNYTPGALFLSVALTYIIFHNRYTQWVEKVYKSNPHRAIWMVVFILFISLLLPFLIERYDGHHVWYLWALVFSNVILSLSLWAALIVRTLRFPVGWSRFRGSRYFRLLNFFWLFFALVSIIYAYCWLDPVKLQYLVPYPAALVLFIFSFLIIVLTLIYHFFLRASFIGLALLFFFLLCIKSFLPERNPYQVSLLHQSKQEKRMPFKDYAEQWIYHRIDSNKAAVPCLFVLAEGGGIRSSYWTSYLLARLRDRLGISFNEKIFAITGASGGAVGAAVYTAFQGEEIQDTEVEHVNRFFSHNDFLTPTLGAFFSRDWFYSAISHIYPVKFEEDRGRELEEGFEEVMQRKFGSRALELPFTKTVSMNKPLYIPHATHVQSGLSGVISPIGLPPTYDDETVDVMEGIPGKADIRLITAGVLSARFPYIGPGSETAPGYQFVDGGYIDNFGAGDALALLKGLYEMVPGPADSLDPILLIISNHSGNEVKHYREVRDLNVPPSTLAKLQMHLMDIHLKKLKDFVREKAGENHIFQFDLKRYAKQDSSSEFYYYPLGWYLSDRSMKGIRRNLDPDFNPLNASKFEKLSKYLQ